VSSWEAWSLVRQAAGLIDDVTELASASTPPSTPVCG
jgi:hypothetical protein